MLWRHLNFHQISHRFISSFVNPSFQYLNGSHIMYWNMIILNLSRFKVEPHSKYWYFCIERWTWDLLLLRFLENDVLFHIEWVCRKNAGNVNWPPYRYTAVTLWACPPSSGEYTWKRNLHLEHSPNYVSWQHAFWLIKRTHTKGWSVWNKPEKLWGFYFSAHASNPTLYLNKCRNFQIAKHLFGNCI